MITTANHPGQRVLFVLLAMLLSLSGFAQNKPFPQAVSWPGCIKPNNVTQATLNSDVTAYYTYWKSQHLKQSTVNTQRYYVKANSTGGSAEAITNSEAHGYGMLITVLMAGYDANAKTYYDGLYRMYDSHRSVNNNNLMQWQVMPDERSRSIGSATDGDMDIAYSLLLAHYQWGSIGAINYLDAAKKMITNGLKASYISPALRLRLADDEGYDDYSTRPSDWMFDHIHAFATHTNDNVWNDLATNLYSVYSQIITGYSSNTGLISDFVMYANPQPAPPYQPQEDEGPTTGKYYYNACRVPLRVVMDYAQYNTASAKTIANKIVTWSKTATGGSPAKIRAGYELNGTALSGSNYETAVFIAPIVAAATCDAAHQQFLNSGWSTIKNMREGYFEDTYNMLCMLYISGNFWKPEATGTPVNTSPTVSLTSPANNATYTTPASVTINATAADADGSVTQVAFYNGSTLLGTDTSSPYSFSWTNVVAGTYSLTARATDNQGAVTTSSAVSITVNGQTSNTPPTVSLTAPSNNATYTAPASVTINAAAADADGSVAQVAFYNGSTLLGTDTSSPYSFSWTNVAAGAYSLTARATDNLGAVTTSAAVTITVNNQTSTQAPVGQTIWLRGFNNAYVSSKNGVGPMWCNAAAVQGWNQFLVGDAGNGKITLSNLGKFVSSENGEQPMTCNRDIADAWEQFDWVVNANGTISLRGNNGMYVSSENGEQAMNCNREEAAGWEEFTYGIVAPAAAKAAVAQQDAGEVSGLLYPNPVKSGEGVTLAIRHTNDTTPVTLVITDTNGTARFTQTVAYGQRIVLPALPKGIYICKIAQGSTVYTQKIQVE